MVSAHFPRILLLAALAGGLFLPGVRSASAEIQLVKLGANTGISQEALFGNEQTQRRPLGARVEVSTDGAVALVSDTPFAEVSIANPDIADITTTSGTALNVLGKRPGRTTLMLTGVNGEVISIADVIVSPAIGDLIDQLKMLLPGEKIDAFTANDGIVLTGTVSSPERMDTAMELAQHYAAGRISNLMTLTPIDVKIDIEGFMTDLSGIFPDGGVHAVLADGELLLTGEVPSATNREEIVRLAQRYAAARVRDEMRVVSPAPVVPDVAMVEARFTDILPNEGIGIHAVANGLVLSGTVSSPEKLQQALQLAKLLANGVTVSNLMTVVAAETCVVVTRRGGEVVKTAIPCSG